MEGLKRVKLDTLLSGHLNRESEVTNILGVSEDRHIQPWALTGFEADTDLMYLVFFSLFFLNGPLYNSIISYNIWKV